MARPRNFSINPKRIALIWAFSTFLFFCVFLMILKNTSLNSSTSSPDAPVSNLVRAKLYEKMARDLDEKGPSFLKHGETSQSLSLSDLFSLKDGAVTPNLKAANPPVRANVLYLSTEYSIPISHAVKNIFSPYFDKAIWFQNSSLYHFSMFHASHHISPVSASHDEVISGTDPSAIRAKLRSALPRAPEKQLYDAAILHTSFARLLGSPRIPNGEAGNPSDHIQLFHDLVGHLNSQITGFQAEVSELWYVEELDVLALALDGKMRVRRFELTCSETPENVS